MVSKALSRKRGERPAGAAGGRGGGGGKRGRKAAVDPEPKRADLDDEEEIESESGEEFSGAESGEERDEDEDEDEDMEATETPADKRLRLAKAYVRTLRAAAAAEVDDEREEDVEEDRQGNRDSRVKATLQAAMREARGYQQRSLAGKVVRPVGGEATPSSSSSSSCRVLKGHHKSVTAVCITPGGDMAFSASKDGTILQWDVATGAKTVFSNGAVDTGYKGAHFPGSFTPAGTSSPRTVLALAVSCDGKYLASGGMDRRVHVWDVQSKEHLVAFPGHKDIISCLVFRDSTHQLFSASFDRTVKSWSLDDMMYTDTLYGHQGEVLGVDCDHRERPVSVSRDHTSRLWKVQDETHLVFRGKGTLDCCALTGPQNWISGGDDGSLCLWGMMKKKPVQILRQAHGAGAQGAEERGLGEASGWVSSTAAVRGSDLVASGAGDGNIRIWGISEDKNSMKHLYSIKAAGFVNSLAFSRSGKVLVAGLGQEPRLGRWARDSKAKNAIFFHHIEYDE